MSKLKVVITDEATGSEVVELGSTAVSPKKAVSNVSPKTNEVRQNRASQKAISIAAMIGQQSFSYITSNVGKWTGNQRNQTVVNNIVQLGSLAAMTYVSPGLALATIGMSLATTAADTAYEQKWDRINSEQALARVGYNSIKEITGRRH